MAIELALLTGVSYRGQEITAPRLRGLLALLAQDPRAGCSTGRLVAGLWPEDRPEHPAKAVQVLVSRLRTHLGAEVIARTPTGYRLALDATRVDSSALLLHEAEAARLAREGDHAGAAAEARAGLALWAGGAATAGEDPDDPVTALRDGRARARASLERTGALALARAGQPGEAVGPLTELARLRPRDEEVLAALLRSEAVTSGPAAALARYETHRRSLREELGTEPGPALRSVHQELLRVQAPAVRHGVPHEPNPLLGREDDLRAVTALLRTARVVTVTGPGGLGKTRLAYAVGRSAEQRVTHVVSLAGITSDEDVAGEVASAVGAGEGRRAGSGDLPGSVLAALGTGPVLLVLDNCEQVVDGVAGLVRTLVARSGELRVLATSRAPLGLSSEVRYALPELTPATSAALFAQRAEAARPGAALHEAEVAELCRQLDGLPLALELAAARVRVLPVPEITRRLRDRFGLLRGASRDAPERHRTLRAVVEWSWNLLEPEGRTALRALSVFPGGFTEEAARSMLGGDEGPDALALLEQLADQSLVKAVDSPSGLRFHMLETIREFGAERRARAGEEEQVTERFLGWARDYARAHHDVLYRDDNQEPFTRIRAEQDNLVLALRHALARADGPATAALTAVLGSLWSIESSWNRLVTLAAETGPPLSHFRPGPADVEVARSAAVVCTSSLFMGYGPHAVRQLVTLRALPPAVPDTLPRALAVLLCAVPEMHGPHYERLTELCAAKEPLLAAVAECVASYVWEQQLDTERALEAARRAFAVLGALRNPALRMLSHGRVSELCLRTERGEEAYRHLLSALDALDDFEDWPDAMGIRWALVLACLQRGESEEAEHWLELAAGEHQDEAALVFTPNLVARGEIALLRGRVDEGLGLWRRAVEQLGRVGAPYADDPFLDTWTLEVVAGAVAAHALAGRPQEVTALTDRLLARLLTLLAAPAGTGSPGDLALGGTALHALGLARLAGGDASGVRLAALAERLPAAREFPPLSARHARRAAERADAAAYHDAVSRYAALSQAELRQAALRALSPADHG
ncbi:BTAD domain-containing putative transcriptional regulator [Streptomyces sp. NPDC049954]|uniref:ATP-binding protein n=1 Tax=Streptomyces sp. NPDC049954 TaxID=3155779 RepID=UPI003415A1C7